MVNSFSLNERRKVGLATSECWQRRPNSDQERRNGATGLLEDRLDRDGAKTEFVRKKCRRVLHDATHLKQNSLTFQQSTQKAKTSFEWRQLYKHAFPKLDTRASRKNLKYFWEIQKVFEFWIFSEFCLLVYLLNAQCC